MSSGDAIIRIMAENSAPESECSTTEITPKPQEFHVSEDALQQLANAVARLSTSDPAWFVQALTDRILAMTPVSRERRLGRNEVQFLIESGEFTAEEWAETSASVDKGSLQLGIAESWLSYLRATLSLKDVAGFLGKSEEDVHTAVAEGHLYAVEISGRLQFPVWQLNVSSPGKVLPGLTELIAAIGPRWRFETASGFMATPQEGLVAYGRQTPIEWLRGGGDISRVTEIVEASEWR